MDKITQKQDVRIGPIGANGAARAGHFSPAGSDGTDGLGWPARLHLALTGFLLTAALGLAYLAVTGRAHFGTPAGARKDSTGEARGPTGSGGSGGEMTGGRYQIEKVDDVRDLLDRAGKLGVFGALVDEVWVYRYTGGYLECQVDLDLGKEMSTAGPLPAEWKGLLQGDSALAEKRLNPVKQGYIVLAAMRATTPMPQALAPYHLHLNGLLAAGTVGPLHALPPLFVEAQVPQTYRLLITAGPPAGERGAGFNVWDNQILRVVTPLVPLPPETEESYVGGGKDLTPERDVLLLDRQRGLSRIRLKARFLGEGKLLDLASSK